MKVEWLGAVVKLTTARLYGLTWKRKMERNVANVDIILNFSIMTLLIQEFDQYMAKGLGLD